MLLRNKALLYNFFYFCYRGHGGAEWTRTRL